MKGNRKRKEWAKRILGILLCVMLCIPNVPFTIATQVTAHADGHYCPECQEYKDCNYCIRCGALSRLWQVQAGWYGLLYYL